MRKRGWIFIPICVAVLILILFKTVFFIGYVPTESMEPTLKKGSIILGVRCFDELNVGDIIVFEHDGRLLVKRIAATEGSMVEINGEILTIPKDSFFVLGDNAGESYDSRHWKEPFVGRQTIRAKL